MEFLDRGFVAIKKTERSTFLSWRLLATDDYETPFHVYRQYTGDAKERITEKPVLKGTNFEDQRVDNKRDAIYTLVRLDGKKEHTEAVLTVEGTDPVLPYTELQLRTPEGYSPGDLSVGDLDGDGSYEIVVHQTGKGHDNAHNGMTDPPIFQAYKMDGTFLWEINLGKNIREGAHYTQFLVYDLDGDGRAEFVCKTGDGTRMV